jgi:hypothetical protein
MSLPQALLDQLLTGYLDDTLSADERVRTEGLIQSDHHVAQELEQLRQLRASLQAIAATDSSIRLSPGFADRVLTAAVDQARTAGLAENHALSRLMAQAQPQKTLVRPTPNASSAATRYAALIVGVAAAIMFAVIALRTGRLDDQVAQRSTGVERSNAPLQTFANVDPDQPSLLGDEQSPTVDVAMANQDANLNRLAQPRSTERNLTERDLTERDLNGDGLAMSLDTESAHESAAPPPRVNGSVSAADIEIGAILVLQVQLTEVGRMNDAVATAMRQAGLESTDRKQLPNELATQLGTATGGIVTEQDLTVIYLQSSAKTLDRFYLNLMGDSDGVQAVGMSLAINAPILKIVQSLATDPTTVRHDSTAVEIAGAPALASELNRLNFAPLNRQTAGAMTQSGPDEPAQILVLVR